MWIDASATDTELLWSPISSFLLILVEITDSSSAIKSQSESFIIFSVSPSLSLSVELSNAKLSPLDNLSMLTCFFLALSMLPFAHTKRLNVSVCNNFHLFFPQNFSTLSCSHLVSFSKMFQIFPVISSNWQF